jgi:hypothetical protein
MAPVLREAGGGTMNTRLFCCLALGALFAIPAAPAAEKIVRRTFPVGPGCRLKVDTFRGSIEVAEGDRPEISVEARLSVPTEDEARAGRAFATVEMDIGGGENEVTILARDPAQTAILFDWEDEDRVELSVRVVVPRTCDVETAIGNGKITVGSLKGAMSARAGSGTIYFKGVDGTVRAETDAGDIIVSHSTGGATLSTKSGSIRVGAVGGGSSLRAVSGDIEIMHAPAGVSASAEAGTVTAGFPAGLSGDSRLATDGGSVNVKIDPAAACTIHAASSALGDVRSTLPLSIVSGGNGKTRLDATLNGGGPVIAIDASGGHVTIESSAPPPPGGRAP